MKNKSEILREMTKAICPEAKYRMLRLEIEVDKRDALVYVGKRVCDAAETLSQVVEQYEEVES